MEVIIKGEPKEIADLVREIQDRRKGIPNDEKIEKAVIAEINRVTRETGESPLLI